MGYTWRQFTTYRTLAQRRYTAAQREQLLLLRAAFAGGDTAARVAKALGAA